jgi:hypothetical protein
MTNSVRVALVAGAAVVLLITYSAYYGAQKDIVLACITAILTVAGWVYGSQSSSTEAARARLHSEKALVYEEIFKFMSDMLRAEKPELQSSKKPAKPESDLLTKKLFDSKSKLMIWGSDTTLAAWMGMEDVAELNDGDVRKMVQCWGKLYASMRKDLGHHDQKISEFDLATFFVKSSDKRSFK